MTALFRSTDPETSRIAADLQTADRRTRMQRVVEDYARSRPEGFTDWDLCSDLTGTPGSTLRSRRNELVDKGVIVDTGRRVRAKAYSGRLGIVWQHVSFRREAAE